MWRRLRSRRGSSFSVSAIELVVNSEKLSALEFGHARMPRQRSRSDQSGVNYLIELCGAPPN
jgi:hypothetical protein